MLGERAAEYYRQGFGCALCIIKAAEDEYKIEGEVIEKALTGITGGFGIDAMCGVPIVCVMIIGLMCGDEIEVKGKRLRFLMGFRDKIGGFNCGEIKREWECEEVIRTGCEILEKNIE